MSCNEGPLFLIYGPASYSINRQLTKNERILVGGGLSLGPLLEEGFAEAVDEAFLDFNGLLLFVCHAH
jgi:hypothetical protein